MISFPLKYEHFICEPFSSLEHRTALFRFEALELIDKDGNSYIPKGLQKSINEDVADMDNANLLKTYLVYGISEDGKKELASVFSLRCSSMNFQNTDEKDSFNEILPALELVYLAVDKRYRNKHPESKGLGAITFDAFTVPVIKEISSLAGAKYLFIFAISNERLVSYYKKSMDFEELPEEMEKSVVNNLVTEYTEKCKFLYQAIDIM